MYHMMIVDDDSFVLEGLKNEIDWKSLGIEISMACSNGREALEALEKVPADILLTDVKMPCMDGLELTREALKRHLGLQIIIISGYSEFEYARQALQYGVFDYLLKPVTVEMIEQVFRRLVEKMNLQNKDMPQRDVVLSPLMRQKVYYDILLGIHNEHTEKVIEEQKKYSRFQIALLKAEPDADGEIQASQNTGKQMMELLSETETLRCVPLLMENSEVSILFLLRLDDGEQAVEQFLKRFRQEVERKLGISFSAGVSGCYKDLRKSGQHLENARVAAEHRFYLGYHQIILYDSLKKPEQMDVSLLIQSRSALLEGLEQWDYKKVMGELDILETLLKRRLWPDMKQVRRIGIELYSLLQSAHHHHSPLVDEESRMYNDTGAQINRAGTLEELFVILRKVYYAVLAGEAMGRKKRRKAVDQVTEYIKDNINTNISLTRISEKIGFSPNYLGKVFKEEMGTGFNEYLMQYRMETAKKLLKSGRYKVYEVSSMVGYKNPNYFSKVFTEYTNGICPSDYEG